MNLPGIAVGVIECAAVLGTLILAVWAVSLHYSRKREQREPNWAIVTDNNHELLTAQEELDRLDNAILAISTCEKGKIQKAFQIAFPALNGQQKIDLMLDGSNLASQDVLTVLMGQRKAARQKIWAIHREIARYFCAVEDGIELPDARERQDPEIVDYAAQTVIRNAENPPNKTGRSSKGRKASDENDEASRHRLTALTIMKTFGNFGIDVIAIGTQNLPATTSYKFDLRSTASIKRIEGLEGDIALALGEEKVLISPVLGEKNHIAVDIPAKEPQIVRTMDLIAQAGNTIPQFSIPLGIGADGKPVFTNLEELPHLLIAGTTGSGKSVFLNSLIVSLIERVDPKDLQFVMIDPKRVELIAYSDLPQLKYPIATTPEDALHLLEMCVEEMDCCRCGPMSALKAKTLSAYNYIAKDAEGYPYFPRIVVVIDELADLIMTSGKKLEDAIIRIAQKGRATGIHLVLATQRPSADIITNKIKGNIKARIAFAAASSTESRIILDTTGAEKLIGRGDMLYTLGGKSVHRAQGGFIEEDEISRVVLAACGKEGGEGNETVAL